MTSSNLFSNSNVFYCSQCSVLRERTMVRAEQSTSGRAGDDHLKQLTETYFARVPLCSAGNKYFLDLSGMHICIK